MQHRKPAPRHGKPGVGLHGLFERLLGLAVIELLPCRDTLGVVSEGFRGRCRPARPFTASGNHQQESRTASRLRAGVPHGSSPLLRRRDHPRSARVSVSARRRFNCCSTRSIVSFIMVKVLIAFFAFGLCRLEKIDGHTQNPQRIAQIMGNLPDAGVEIGNGFFARVCLVWTHDLLCATRQPCGPGASCTARASGHSRRS